MMDFDVENGVCLVVWLSSSSMLYRDVRNRRFFCGYELILYRAVIAA